MEEISEKLMKEGIREGNKNRKNWRKEECKEGRREKMQWWRKELGESAIKIRNKR